MPLMCCPTCGLTVYSAAGHSTTDDCPQCGHVLPPVAPSVNRAMRTSAYAEVMDGYLRRTGQAQASWLGAGF